ncbi:GntR family transcriptional regulator [Sporosarcina sp. P3]|uniref:GntR family transcriptional regulator n=1 Tax=Sporosarcina TaxID=1569 RepID=UPI0009DC6E23|nr:MULTISPECIES: GntR family transcriptional regulator [Sporosarcina]ARF17783.1 transcriptional regulator [Sporosarcina ureae]PID21151.1 GntR family transcriptional regulator [Sporosarcina sp. P3]
MDSNVRIKRIFMRDEAYEILQNWIIIGKLAPGAILRDQELSDLLGISRTPIREALLRLERDGLVVTKANRSTSVSQVDYQEAANVYPIVATLERLAAEQAFQQISSEVIQEMEELNNHFIDKLQSDDKVAAFQIDNEFHQKLVSMSNNPELINLLINLKIKVQRLEVHYFGQVSNGEKSIDEHKAIIEALKNKDLKKILDAIEANWKNSLARIIEVNTV